MVCLNSFAAIFYLDLIAGFGVITDRNHSALSVELNSVVDQIRQHLHQSVRISKYLRILVDEIMDSNRAGRRCG